jgi:hypothetical protein
VAKYALQWMISDEPVFSWWVAHVLKKIAKVNSKYWQRSLKFGIDIPKRSVEEAQRLFKKMAILLFGGMQSPKR